MSSWIKLIDQSFTKTERRQNRSKIIQRDIATANIEDDSSQESSDLNLLSSSTKKRKLNPLHSFTIENEGDSSDECDDVNTSSAQLLNTKRSPAVTSRLSIGRNTSKRQRRPLGNLTIENEGDSSDDVEYNPDGVQLPDTARRKLKAALPIVTRPSSTSHISSNTKPQLRPLASLTIGNGRDASEGCYTVEYESDDAQLPNTVRKNFKETLPLTVGSNPVSHPSSTIQCTSSFPQSHPWKTWLTIPTSNDKTNSSLKIEDSLSDESSSHTLIDESSDDNSLVPSPNVQQQETMIETQESITPPVAPFIATASEPPKKRKVRMKKGGMVEQLKKSLSQAKSNLLFWQHHRSAELIPPGDTVRVNRVEKTYGRTLIHAKVNGEETIFSLCSRSLDLQVGDIIEVNFDVDRVYRTDTCSLYPYVDKVEVN